jgi:hypothetical protein
MLHEPRRRRPWLIFDVGQEMTALRSKLSTFHSWANHGWPSVGFQSAGGLLLVFGIGCIVQVQWGDFLFGPIFGFVSLLVGEKHLSSVGCISVAASVLLFLLTFSAQRRQFARFRRDQAMLQRQDWRR